MGSLDGILNTLPAPTPEVEAGRVFDVYEGEASLSIQAAVTGWGGMRPNERLHHLQSENWERRLMHFDEFGDPGVLGSALDTIANQSSLLTFGIGQHTARGVETIEAPALLRLLHMFRTAHTDFQQTVGRLFRILDAPGSGAIGMYKDDDQWVYVLSPKSQVSTTVNQGSVTFSTSRSASPVVGQRMIPNHLVWWFHSPDPEFPDDPWSPHKRALPALEGYFLASEAIRRAKLSAIATNRVIWAPRGSGQKGDPKWMGNMSQWIQFSTKERPPGAPLDLTQAAPFMLSTEGEPKVLDLSAANFEQLMAVAEWHLKEYARTADIPTRWLMEGPGTEKYANAHYQNNHFADHTMAHRSARVASVLTRAILRPWLRSVQSVGMLSDWDADQVCVVVDDSRVRATEDDARMKYLLAREGWYKGRELALELADGDESKVGFGPAELERGSAESPTGVFRDDLIAF